VSPSTRAQLLALFAEVFILQGYGRFTIPPVIFWLSYITGILWGKLSLCPLPLQQGYLLS
jgi:hypothetical protein